MIDKKIVDIVEDLKYNTKDSINSIQKASLPHYIDMKQQQVFRYVYDCEECYIDPKQLLFEVPEIPLKSFSKRKNKLIFKDKFINMINRQEVHPILVFINGKFIKWSKMEIWSDYRKIYLLINEPIKVVSSFSTIYIPFNVYYSETGNKVGTTPIFSFNSNGILDNNGTTVVSMNKKDIFYDEITSDIGLRNIEINIPLNLKISENNIILFKKGSPYTNPDIRLDGLNIFTVDDGLYVNGNQLVCKIFYNKSGNISKDNVLNVLNMDYIKGILKGKHYGGIIPDYFEELMKEFNFKYEEETYSENVQKALLYIMLYNFDLLNKLYEDTSNLISVNYTGKEIKDKIDSTGYLKLPRRRVTTYDDYVMVFVNGELYRHYGAIVYENNFFKLPIRDIEDTDTVELLFFKNVDNTVYKSKISKAESFTILDPSIDLNKLKIYSQTVDIADYYLEKDERIQYDVDYTIEYINGKPKIIFASDYFYNRPVTLVSSNQFRYAGHTIPNETISVTLPPEFNYCRDESRYMIFVNGRKVNKENYRLTIVNPSVPFTDLSMYIQLPLLKGDKLDIFYVPSSLTELIMEPTIPIDGNIVVDKTKISYNLNKELYLFFVNGKKINKNQMIDISSTNLMITRDIETVKNLCLIKHITDDVTLKQLFDDNISSWDNIMNNITEEELYTLMNIIGITISDTEEDIFAKNLPMPSVLREIVRDYWLRTNIVDSGQVFVYDYDQRVVENYDSEGNAIIPVMDASKQDNIEFEE